MERNNRSINDRRIKIGWNEIIQKAQRFDKSKKYYGVPRGGQYIAALLNPVDTPEEADIIIDDLIDSGSTQAKYKALYPNKPFIGLFDKQTDFNDKWAIFPWEVNDTETDIEDHMRRVIQYFDDVNREGLKDTPKRYIKFLKEFMSPKPFEFTTFENEGTNQMITQKDIHFYSLCEHHLAPFYGTAKVSYIPDKRIIGLSKLARTVDYYARKFQNQERITELVAQRLMDELKPLGVGVTIEAHHLCMSMRGIKKPQALTQTTSLKGVYQKDKVKKEFLRI